MFWWIRADLTLDLEKELGGFSCPDEFVVVLKLEASCCLWSVATVDSLLD